MSLKTAFNKYAKTVFKVFESVVLQATYVKVTDSGFEPRTTQEIPVDIILDSFSERDVQFLSFSTLIQPTDVKGLVRGEQLTGIEVATVDMIVIDSVNYHIIHYSVDPANAIYTLLLRRV